MKCSSGFSLIEVLMVLAIMSILSLLTYPFFTSFQFQNLSEINKSDLNTRANRLLNYLAEEVQETGFLVTSVPRNADDTPFQIKHGADLVAFNQSIQVGNLASGNDRLDVLKAISFFPPLTVTDVITGPPQRVKINRPPNYATEINDSGGVNLCLTRNHVIFENHKKIYRVTDVTADSPDLDTDGDGRRDRLLRLLQPLAEPVPIGSEVLAVRARGFFVDAGGLRSDDYVTSAVLDRDVDGLQFKFYMVDGSQSDGPSGSQIEEVRGIRISLLVKAKKPEKDYFNSATYQLEGQVYGPFNDDYRRVVVERLLEVRNYALE